MAHMVQKLKMALLVMAVALSTVVFGGVVAQAAAVDPKTEVTNGITSAGGGSTVTDLPTLVQSIISVLLFIVGAVAVVMIIIGGLRYVTSNGDQSHVKAAKDTILYSVIGLIVAILAYAIVQFVVSKL